MPADKSNLGQPKVVLTTDRLVVYDAIAGDYFGAYDDKILIFGKDIVNALRYIRLCYDYVWTGASSVSWLEPLPIENKFKLEYTPNTDISYYIYNEIQHKFHIINPSSVGSPLSVLAIGNNYGVIEYLAHITRERLGQSTFIATHYFPEKLEIAKRDIQQEMMDKAINSAVITTTSEIYKLLDGFESVISPVDIYTYDNFEMVRHFELMFGHTNTLSNIIGIISGLKYTKPGGTFIIHMYCIINKTNADLFILAKQYFAEAYLYMPECVNPFNHSGTWAIFKGFKGISAGDFANLMDIVAEIRKHYPNGISDNQVYEPDIRALCWGRKSFPRPGPRVPYITGFYDIGLADPVYNEIIDFNNQIYKRKLDFCNEVLVKMSEIKYPEKMNVPTPKQQQKTIKYFRDWNISYKPVSVSRGRIGNTGKKTQKHRTSINRVYTYLIKSNTFTPQVITDEFARRGNWEPYNEKHARKPVDFLFVDGAGVDDKSLYSIKSDLKSLVGDSKKQITDKQNLYKNLSRIPGAKKFLPFTIPFSIKDTNISYLNRFKQYFKPGKPYICKVIKGGAGMGIITTDKYDEFYRFMQGYYNKMTANPGKFKQFEWVLQEYITNPWLVDGRKMHLRQLMVYQADPRKPSYYMYSGEFAIAEKPYIRRDWTNKDIHDTHFHKGIGHKWPFDMNFTAAEWEKVKAQFDYIYACILEVMKGRGECYDDSKRCFELLGLDFMITTDLRVILIEVNDKVGMTPSKEFADKIFKSLLVYVVDDYFPPKYQQQEYLAFFPIKTRVNGARLKSARTHKKSSKYLL